MGKSVREDKRLEKEVRDLQALLRIFVSLFFLRTRGPLKDLEQRLTCVVHVESDVTNLIFTGDVEDSGLENGSGGVVVCVQECLQGNREEEAFAFVPVGNNTG